MSIASERIPKLDLAWLAGFIDGEGCFRSKRCTNRAIGRVYYQPTLAITNTDHELLERVQEIVGWGPIIQNNHPESYGPWKPRWQWVISGRPRTSAVLKAVKPWLGTAKVADAGRALERRTPHAIGQDPVQAQFHEAALELLPCPSRRGQLRRDLGLTQAELAKELGVGKSTVSNWEAGGCNAPRGQTLLDYIVMLGVDLAPLFR